MVGVVTISGCTLFINVKEIISNMEKQGKLSNETREALWKLKVETWKIHFGWNDSKEKENIELPPLKVNFK